ncbi:MAG: hypothetical protein WD315_04510 [Balneolaceae bacterium]
MGCCASWPAPCQDAYPQEKTRYLTIRVLQIQQSWAYGLNRFARRMYHRPWTNGVQTTDTVSTARPETLQERLASLNEVAPLSSIVIQHRGKIVASHYFDNTHAGHPHNVKSVAKSILSILTGIAIDQGYLEGTDQQIGEFFPDWFE